MNKLYYGDCLNVLRTLPAESVDLIYLDPPFNSKRNYSTFFKSASGTAPAAQILAFEDTWHWGSQSQSEFEDLLRNPDAGILGEKLLEALYAFLGTSNMMAYLVMMASRLVELKRILKKTGSLYLHCDPTASHYLKIVLDGIFGKENFQNEIIWKRTSAHNNAKKWGAIHDTILFYTKGNNYVWNEISLPLDEEYLKNSYKYEDEHGRYKVSDLTGPGVSKGEAGAEWHGISLAEKKRCWAVPLEENLPDWVVLPDGYSAMSLQERLDILDEQGLIYWPKKENGMPRFKKYLTDDSGIRLQDVINDIPPLGAHAKERLGYPTQKPSKLLERIIQSSSNVGDVVLDPFCGCGTAIHAAEKLGRQWIGIDITHLAIALIRQRMHNAFPDCQFTIEGTPKDVDSAKFLAENNGLNGRYQFQYWALSLINAMPSQDKKKGSDKGVDGYIWAHEERALKKPYKIIVSVKSGKIPANHIREMQGLLDDKTKMAFLITLEEPSRNMKNDALAAGYYPEGTKYQRIQVFTIEALLNGAKPDYLDYSQGTATMKQAEQEKKDSIPQSSLLK